MTAAGTCTGVVVGSVRSGREAGGCVGVGSTAVARVEPWGRALVRKWRVAVWGGGSYIEFVSRCDHKLSITDR